jgi:hypothetical protein
MMQPEPDKFPKGARAKYLGLLRFSQNQYLLQNLFILSAGDRQNRASPKLTNPLLALAPARWPNFINLSVAIQ